MTTLNNTNTSCMTRFDNIMRTAAASVLNDLESMTEWARNFYENGVLVDIEQRAKIVSLAPYIISRPVVDRNLDDAQLLFNKVTENETIRIVSCNIVMQELAALLVADGFNVFWENQPDTPAELGMNLVVEFIPSDEFKHDYLTSDTVAGYRDAFFATWQNA
jgi:hypothetical protein